VVVDRPDEISVEELQDALDNVDGKKPTQRLLAAIAYKNGVTQTELAEWYDVQRRTIYSWLEPFLSINELGENVKYQNHSRKNSKKSFTIHLKRSGSMRRRGRRRLPRSISKKPTALSIQSRVVGGC
jgi:hypothetical protein